MRKQFPYKCHLNLFEFLRQFVNNINIQGLRRYFVSIHLSKRIEWLRNKKNNGHFSRSDMYHSNWVMKLWILVTTRLRTRLFKWTFSPRHLQFEKAISNFSYIIVHLIKKLFLQEFVLAWFLCNFPGNQAINCYLMHLRTENVFFVILTSKNLFIRIVGIYIVILSTFFLFVRSRKIYW